MTDAMKRTVINGTPRQSSMKATQMALMIGILERRPSASTMPIGSEATIPTTAITRVRNRPPHSGVSMNSKDAIVTTPSDGPNSHQSTIMASANGNTRLKVATHGWLWALGRSRNTTPSTTALRSSRLKTLKLMSPPTKSWNAITG